MCSKVKLVYSTPLYSTTILFWFWSFSFHEAPKKRREKIYHSIHIYCNDTIREKRERERDPSGGCYRCVELARKSQLYIPAFLSLFLFFSHYVHTHSTVYITHTYTYRYARREYVCSCVCAVYLVEWAERKQTLSQNPAIQWMELILDGWMRFILFHFIFCYSSFESIKHTHTRPDEREQLE